MAAAWMDLEGIMQSDISQTEKDRCCMISHVESKNYIELVNITKNKNRLTDIENKLVVASGEREWGGATKGSGLGERVLMGLYKVMGVRLVKHYRI